MPTLWRISKTNCATSLTGVGLVISSKTMTACLFPLASSSRPGPSMGCSSLSLICSGESPALWKPGELRSATSHLSGKVSSRSVFSYHSLEGTDIVFIFWPPLSAHDKYYKDLHWSVHAFKMHSLYVARRTRSCDKAELTGDFIRVFEYLLYDILIYGIKLIDRHKGYMDRRGDRNKPWLVFVKDHTEGPGFGHCEISRGNACINGKRRFTEGITVRKILDRADGNIILSAERPYIYTINFSRGRQDRLEPFS